MLLDIFCVLEGTCAGENDEQNELCTVSFDCLRADYGWSLVVSFGISNSNGRLCLPVTV